MRLSLPATTAALLFAALPARAETLTHITGEGLVELLAAKGQEAVLATDATGDPLLVVEATDTTPAFQVVTYDCTDDAPAACETIIFRALYDMEDYTELETLRRTNAWNTDKVFARAYRNGEGDAELDMTFTFRGGATGENLSVAVDNWLTGIGEVYAYLYD